MLPSKVEIKLKKAEPGAWSKLDFPRTEDKKEPESTPKTEEPVEDDLVDLSGVETLQNLQRVNFSELEELE